MKSEFEMKDDILVAILSGELDHHNASTVRTEIDGTMDAYKVKNLILDFSNISFVDSSGIGMVMGRYNKVKEKEGKILIVGCSPYMEKILEMAGIFTIIGKCKDVKQAIMQLEGEVR